MKEEVRKGNQVPTTRICEPYETTLGDDALEFYKKAGRTPLPWQSNLIRDMMAVNSEGLWQNMTFGYSLPRRNGKNEGLVIRELYALMNGEQTLHTAHRTTTSHTAWERLVKLLSTTGLEEGEDYKTHKQFGLERIELFSTGGRVSFRTRSSKGALGEGFDLLVIDEAQEYTDDQQSALNYVVSDSPNPQVVMCGTPPTSVSAGTVFEKYRSDCLNGHVRESAWEDWGIDKMSDPEDVELWYQVNPSLGYHLKERNVRRELGKDAIDFNIQRLGVWLKYNQKSAISQKEWDDLKIDVLPTLVGKLHVGIKFGHGTDNVCMSIACKTSNGRVFVESIDCRKARQGFAWLIDFIRNADIEKVIIDGQSGQRNLNAELKDFGLQPGYCPTVDEVVSANSLFEQGIEQKTICHNGQPSLANVVSNCEKRNIGTKGGYGFKSLNEEREIALLDSVILAYWSAMTTKPKKKQRISF